MIDQNLKFDPALGGRDQSRQPRDLETGYRGFFISMDDLLTPGMVAAELHVSEDSVLRWFGNREGVFNLGSPELVGRKTGRKRRYRVLRIPRAILQKFLMEHRIT